MNFVTIHAPHVGSIAMHTITVLQMPHMAPLRVIVITVCNIHVPGICRFSGGVENNF